MAKNEQLSQSDDLALEVGTAVPSGAPVRVGTINGVTQTESGDLVNTAGHSSIATSYPSGFAAVKTNGVHKLEVVLTGNRAAGFPVYATPPSGNAITTLTDVTNSGANKLFGALYKAETSGTKIVPVLLATPVVV